MIRAATTADADAIWALLEPVFRAGETYAVATDISRDASLQMWLTTPAATFVAETAGKIVGTYYIKPNQQGGGAHICNCGYIVDAGARGQGVAGEMCRHSLQQARAMGFLAMQFNFVLASNISAVRLWQRHGFRTLGRIPAAFQHPRLGLVDALILHRPLDRDFMESDQITH